MLRAFLPSLFVLLLCACVEMDEHTPPQIRMTSHFNQEFAPQLLGVAEQFASKHTLQLRAWEFDSTTESPSGEAIVFLDFMLEGSPVLTLSTVSNPEILTFSATDFGHVPREVVEKLAESLQLDLERKFDLKFQHRMEPWSADLTSE